MATTKRITRRKATGAHFTPPELARLVANRLYAAHGEARRHVLRVLDPSCGDGELLAAFADVLGPTYLSRTELIGVARFLRDADDVDRFAKLPEQFHFAIEYTDAAGNLRYYEPDFVAVTKDGKHRLLETKGLEDIHVAAKDQGPAERLRQSSANAVFRSKRLGQI